MHLLFVAIGTNGDVFPLLAIAQAMVARGHRATLLADYGHGKYLAGTGIGYVPLSTADDHERVLRDKLISQTRYGGLFDARHSVRWNQVILEAIECHAASDLIVFSADRPNLWADLVARRHFNSNVMRAVVDLPILRDVLPTYLPPGSVQKSLDNRCQSLWASYLTGRHVGTGWNQLLRIFRSTRLSVPTVALWPEWIVSSHSFDKVKSAFGFMPLPYIPQSLRTEIGEGVIAFIAGTEGTTKEWARGFLRTAADACRQLGVEGVVLGCGTECPAGLTGFDFVPLPQLLSHAITVVHHGGIGTAAAALEQGIPQIIIPRVFAQPVNAEWLRRLGVCAVISPSSWNSHTAVSHLKRVMYDQAMRENSRIAAKRIDRQASLLALCTFLEESSA